MVINVRISIRTLVGEGKPLDWLGVDTGYWTEIPHNNFLVFKNHPDTGKNSFIPC